MASNQNNTSFTGLIPTALNGYDNTGVSPTLAEINYQGINLTNPSTGNGLEIGNRGFIITTPSQSYTVSASNLAQQIQPLYASGNPTILGVNETISIQNDDLAPTRIINVSAGDPTVVGEHFGIEFVGNGVPFIIKTDDATGIQVKNTTITSVNGSNTITIDASLNTITAGTFVGNLTGTASSATTATNATNATNASYSTTQTTGDNSTKIATTAFVQSAIPSLSGYATLSGTETFTGNVSFSNPITGNISGSASTSTTSTNATNASYSTTQTTGDNSTKIATTAFVQSSLPVSATPTTQGIVYGKTSSVSTTDLGLGYNALALDSSGNYNTAIGYNSLSALTSGSFVASITGFSSGSYTGGTGGAGTYPITFVGGGATIPATGTAFFSSGTRKFLTITLTSGGVGYTSVPTIQFPTPTGGWTITTAPTATAVISSSSNVNNTAVGYSTLSTLNGGYNNTIVGANAGTAITNGFQNNCFGNGAGKTITTGTNNVLIGNNQGIGITTGQYNVLIGDASGNRVSGYVNSTAIGFQALDADQAGSSNTAVGYQAGMNSMSGQSNTTIGYNSAVPVPSASNQIVLGTIFDTLYIQGALNYQVGTSITSAITLSAPLAQFYTINCSTAFTITLPSPSYPYMKGQLVQFKRVGSASGVVSFSVGGGTLFIPYNGIGLVSTPTLSTTQYQTSFISDGVSWYQINTQ